MKNIRSSTWAIIRNKNKILVYRGRDSVKNQAFYRPLGGGIEFGEESIVALKREFKEELNTEIKNENFLKVIENIFTYEGEDMHEIVFMYEAEFVDKEMYEKDNMKILDAKHAYRAMWVDVEKFDKEIIYPIGIKELL